MVIIVILPDTNLNNTINNNNNNNNNNNSKIDVLVSLFMYSQCYSHLTEWKDLETASTNNIDDHTPPRLDSVWSDTYYQVSKCNDNYVFST